MWFSVFVKGIFASKIFGLWETPKKYFSFRNFIFLTKVWITYFFFFLTTVL